MVHYVYGGRNGHRRELVLDENLIVVRTKGTVASARSMLLGTELSKVAHRMSPVMRLAHVGVEVLRSDAESSTQARQALQKKRGIRFAGRCLVDPQSGQPVLYTENLFVKFKDDVDDAACRKELARLELKVARPVQYARKAYFVKAPEGIGREVFERANELFESGFVEFCHPELVREVRRRAYPEQWHLHPTSVNAHANVAAAWATTRGEGTAIAIIDDGVDLEHREFARPSKILAPFDATRGVEDPRPGSGDDHGTACAGVACADGIGRASGAAPGARLMPIRLVSGLGSMQEADAFYWAVAHGADVISCSWGPVDGQGLVTPLPDSTRLAIEHAVNVGRGGKGCVILWATGNGDESADDDGYASCPKVIAVAACNDKSQRSWYSDQGDCVWCCCPSSDGPTNLGIFTTDRRGAAGYNPGRADLGDVTGDYTNDFGGTSSAAPLAAGIAALVVSRNPLLRWTDVREILRNSADRIDVANGQYSVAGHSKAYGYGRLNAAKAVAAALPAAPARRVVHTVFRDVPIKDLGPDAILELVVADSAPPKDVRVTVDIDHTWRGDLVVALKAPGREGRIVLHSTEGGGANGLRETYDPVRIPEIAELRALSPVGAWELFVKDIAKEDEGFIRSFSVELQY
jgi:subtilisin family serine protease